MKECYAVKPAEVEVFSHGGASDIILRKNIQEVPEDDGGTRWECDERQMRVASAVSVSAIKASFAHYWAVAGGETPLIELKQQKIDEMSAACHTAIVHGFDSVLGDGISHHFSLSVEDQLNINALYGLIASGESEVPYHADGEMCRMFSATEFNCVVRDATAHKTYHESYFNSLKQYINSKKSASAVVEIAYGDEIPAQYQSAVLQALTVR